MPLYDYYCKDCNKTFELLVKSTTVPVCPACGGAQLEKQVSLTAPQGQTSGVISRARSQAAKEGHFSNYSKAERAKLR